MMILVGSNDDKSVCVGGEWGWGVEGVAGDVHDGSGWGFDVRGRAHTPLQRQV